MNRTAQSGMIGFGIFGGAAFGIPGAIGGMILGALLGWWMSRRVITEEKRLLRTITETPGVQGGYPCVENTRIPVRSIVEAWRGAGDDLDVLYSYTDGIGLSRAEVQHALLWYVAHPERVDEDVARQRAAWEAWDKEREDDQIDRLDEIEARLQNVTPPPWRARHLDIVREDDYDYLIHNGVAGDSYSQFTQSDCAFIAAVREDVPWLIAEIRRLRTPAATGGDDG